MKPFKQVLSSALGLIALIFLVACAPKTQTLNLQDYSEDNGTDARITLYHQGDRLLKAEATSITLYTNKEVADAKEAEERFGNPPEMLGYKYNYDFQKDRYIEHIEVDFEKALEDKDNSFLQEALLSKDGKYVSFEKMKEYLFSIRFKVIEGDKFQELPD